MDIVSFKVTPSTFISFTLVRPGVPKIWEPTVLLLFLITISLHFAWFKAKLFSRAHSLICSSSRTAVVSDRAGTTRCASSAYLTIELTLFWGWRSDELMSNRSGRADVGIDREAMIA